MYRAVVFAFLGVTVLAGDMRKCGKLFRPETMQCCKEMPPPPDASMDPSGELKECFDMPMKPPSCAREECIAKKKGYLSSSGGIDKEALADILDKDNNESPEITALIKEKCIKGDISKYGPPNMCEFVKMKTCFHMQFMQKCPEWSDKGDCSGVKELIEECS